MLRPGDIVWIHDFSLMLVPSMLRAKALPPRVRLGYFHHAQFPSSEVFRCIPPRAVLLFGALGADVVGFHHYTYGRYFVRACTTLLPDCQAFSDGVEATDGRLVQFSIYPGGVDASQHRSLFASPSCAQHLSMLRETFGHRTPVVCVVPSLDESQGAQHVLAAFEIFLEKKKRARHDRDGENEPILILHVASPARPLLGLVATAAKDVQSTRITSAASAPPSDMLSVSKTTEGAARDARRPVPSVSAMLKVPDEDADGNCRRGDEYTARSSQRGSLCEVLSARIPSPQPSMHFDRQSDPSLLHTPSASAEQTFSPSQGATLGTTRPALALPIPPKESFINSSALPDNAFQPTTAGGMDALWDAHTKGSFTRFVRGGLSVQRPAEPWWRIPDLSAPHAGAVAPDVPVVDPHKVRERVARINGRYGGLNYTPIVLLQSDSLELSVALSAVADVNICLPIREGLSVDPQYAIIAQDCANGAAPVVLSEFCGSESLLPGCIPVNPFDARAVAAAMEDALAMPSRERRDRHAANMAYIDTHGVREWVRRVILRALPSESLNTDEATPSHSASHLDPPGDAALWSGNVHRQRPADVPGPSEGSPTDRSRYLPTKQQPLDVPVLLTRFAAAKRRVLVFAYTGTLVRETVLESCWPTSARGDGDAVDTPLLPPLISPADSTTVSPSGLSHPNPLAPDSSHPTPACSPRESFTPSAIGRASERATDGIAEQRPALETLRALVSLPDTDVYVFSGRSLTQLQSSELAAVEGLGLAAEWGTWVRWAHSSSWECQLPPSARTDEADASIAGTAVVGDLAAAGSTMSLNLHAESTTRVSVAIPWLADVERVCQDFEERVPGSRTERKCASITWHFGGSERLVYGDLNRTVDTARDLEDQLKKHPLASQFQTFLTDKCLEVRIKGASKGRTLQLALWSRAPTADFLLCVGDDRLDQDMIDAATLFRLGVGPAAAPSLSLTQLASHLVSGPSTASATDSDVTAFRTSMMLDGPSDGDRLLVTTFHPPEDAWMTIKEVCTVSVGRLNVRRADSFVDNPAKLLQVLNTLVNSCSTLPKCEP